MPVGPDYRPAPRFAEIGEGFFDVVAPARFPRHTRRFRNQRWAERVGLGTLDDAEWEKHFARFEPLPGNLREPLALRYHGHQFGVYNPNLGDGRGFLFAQLLEPDPPKGRGWLLDLGTKGSGQTPWSRGGDGRLTLKGGVREVLATEMLEALGVNTSKSFSLFETGERLMRGDEPSPTRSSVLVRLSHSHVRFGSFQRHAHEGDEEKLQTLFDFAVENYLPEVQGEGAERVMSFLRAVARRSAELAASWMVAGFVHGVLNTDNMNITGESFDYGPYRFLPTYDPSFVAAYFDEVGLYAFGRQTRTMVWNLTRLADAVRMLAPGAALAHALYEFEPAFDMALIQKVMRRLGLKEKGMDVDAGVVEAAYAFMAASKVGYDQFFFDWYGGLVSEARALAGPSRGAYAGPEFEAFKGALAGYEAARPELLEEAYFKGQVPCSLLYDEIEAIWAPIAAQDDWSRFEAKIEEIRAMGALYSGGDGAQDESAASGASNGHPG